MLWEDVAWENFWILLLVAVADWQRPLGNFSKPKCVSALWCAAEPGGFSKNIVHVLELTPSCWRRAIRASLAPRDLVTLPGVVEWLEAPLDFLIDATGLCHFHPNLSNQKSALGTP